jgi:hypothetical protein
VGGIAGVKLEKRIPIPAPDWYVEMCIPTTSGYSDESPDWSFVKG